MYLAFILMLAVFLGFELISKVPSTLHTPLMSGANAISGITLVGAILSAGAGPRTIGGDAGDCRRHLCDDQCGGRLFGDQPHAFHVQEKRSVPPTGVQAWPHGLTGPTLRPLFFLPSASNCSVRPATARRGNLVSALGMAIAVAATLNNPALVDFAGWRPGWRWEQSWASWQPAGWP